MFDTIQYPKGVLGISVIRTQHGMGGDVFVYKSCCPSTWKLVSLTSEAQHDGTAWSRLCYVASLYQSIQQQSQLMPTLNQVGN